MKKLRPIRTDAAHAEALLEIERLWGAPVGSAEGDRLEVLAMLVEAYEDKRWPMRSTDPVEIIEYVMGERGLGRRDLADLFGSASRASEILSRKRPLTLSMIRRLAEEWRIPIALLTPCYSIGSAA